MSLITIKHQKDFCVTATVRNHTLILDAPPELGGMDVGPTPVELLAMAVGTCMAMHIVKFCKASRLPHEGLALSVDFQLAKNPPRVASMTVGIESPPGFPEDHIPALKRAAEQCVVKNTLSQDTSVDVEVLAAVP